MATAGEIAALSQARAAASIGEDIYKIGEDIYHLVKLMSGTQSSMYDTLVEIITPGLVNKQKELHDSLYKKLEEIQKENESLRHEMAQLRQELQEQKSYSFTR